MLFVLKTIALTHLLASDHFPRDDDLLSIVLWQAIIVLQESLHRLNVLQVSLSKMLLVVNLILSCCLSLCRVEYFLFRLVR